MPSEGVARSMVGTVAIAAAGAVLLLAAADIETLATPDSVTCTGYPEKRVFLENQSWVEPQLDDGSGHPGIGQQGHIHMGTCFPLHQTLTSDTLGLDIRFQQHNVVADPVFIKVQAYTFLGTKVVLQPPPIPRCETVDCDQWVHVDFPLDEILESGWVNLQIWLSVDIPDGTADGIQWYNINRWFVYLDNGKPLHYPANQVRIGGDTWIENEGGLGGNYSESKIDIEDFPWDFTTGQMIPLSGMWTPNVHFDPSPAPGHGMAMIDPALHAVPVNHGMMVYDGPGARDVDLSINTTLLANGMHRLLLVSCNSHVVASSQGFTNCGVLVVPFLINNTTTTTTTVPTSTTTAPTMTTLRISPIAGGDDGARDLGGVFRPLEDPRIGKSSGVQHFSWFRFPAVTIPQGATIDAAYLVLNVTGTTGSGTIRSNVYAIDEDTHAAPTNNSTWLGDHGAHTSSFAVWDFPVASGTLQTASLAAVIQEVVDRPGWVSGNAIGIHIDDDGTVNGNRVNFDDIEGTVEAVLHIEYTETESEPLNAYDIELQEKGVYSWWPLDETSGTILRDVMGRDHLMTSGTPLLDQAGPTAMLRGVSFDGVDDYAEANPTGAADWTTASAVVWMKTTAPNQVHGEGSWLIGNGPGPHGIWETGDTNVWTWHYRNDSDVDTDLEFGTIVPEQWEFVAWTLDATGIRVYQAINGVVTEVGSDPNLTHIAADIHRLAATKGAPPAEFGKYVVAGPAIFDSTLTLNDLQDIYDSAQDADGSAVNP